MNVSDILKRVAGAGIEVAASAIPGGSAVLSLVNSFLPPEKKLPETATGQQLTDAVASLPPEQRLALMSKELDVEIAKENAWVQVQGSLAAADESGKSTRPEIALMMAKLVVGITVAEAVAIAWVATTTGKFPPWELVAALLSLPTVLLRAYFGMRTEEKKARYAAAVGGEVAQGSALAGVFKAFTK